MKFRYIYIGENTFSKRETPKIDGKSDDPVETRSWRADGWSGRLPLKLALLEPRRYRSDSTL